MNFIKSKLTFHGLDDFCVMPDNNEENVSFGKNTYSAKIINVNIKYRVPDMNYDEFYLYIGLFKYTECDLKKIF